MISLGMNVKVFLAVGGTDMRKGIDGLAVLVSSQLEKDPFSGHVFAFCNRGRDAVKILLWDTNGFWVLHKRLERQRFRWPRTESEVMEMTVRELNWLLDGLDPLCMKGHKKLEYSSIY